MVETLWFQGVQFGTGVLYPDNDTAPQTPPGIQSALFQNNAQVISDSRNFLYLLTVYVWMKAASHWDFEAAVAAIKSYSGQAGLMEIKNGSTVIRRWAGCTLLAVPKPDIPKEFGGRFVEDWPLTFAHSSDMERL